MPACAIDIASHFGSRPFVFKLLFARAEEECFFVGSFCVFVSRLMGRRGWSSFPVPKGWVQLVRGPRPKSVQWPRASKEGKPQQQRAPGMTSQQGRSPQPQTSAPIPTFKPHQRWSLPMQWPMSRGWRWRLRSMARTTCMRRVFKMRCESQDQSASCLRASGNVQDFHRKGQETSPASTGSDGQGSFFFSEPHGR